MNVNRELVSLAARQMIERLKDLALALDNPDGSERERAQAIGRAAEEIERLAGGVKQAMAATVRARR